MSLDPEIPLPLAVFAAETQGRLRYRLPLVTYTNVFETGVRTAWMSPQVEAVTGYEVREWIEDPAFFARIVHPDDRPGVIEEMRRSRERLQPFSRDYRLRARDGRDVWIHDESVPVLDPTGRPEFIQGYFVDITERKHLEEALRHAQKTEAVGRLAAGIAHDFNNLLTAIGGYSELALKALPDDHPARRPLREVLAVVQRAVRLTRQLLAFSRRQELRPEVVDLSEVVRGMESMLLHVAGAGVQVDFALCETAEVNADLGQLEQVLMNLVANARDALDGGGRVSIATDRATIVRGTESERLGIPPGDYAVLAVADTGMGMDPETVARVFDPFFTTKERGSGTGLGLATVHGIVRQSGGAVDVSSVTGSGTTFRVLLPVATLG
jgi:two-component system cell cycle sensor histidine kinase/response regulator CckA